MPNPLVSAAHRLRIGRRSEANRIYLVTVTTYQRTPFFDRLTAGRTVVSALKQTANAADTLCFVVMPDHLHWLMQLNEVAQLSATVQKVKSISTRQLHRQGLCEGDIWQRGFHDRALRREDDIRAAARYIVANPIRAGLVRSVREYPLWDAVWV